MKCLIEGCERECNSFLGLSMHVIQTHKISTKQYYNLFLRKLNDGFCKRINKDGKLCEKNTTFINLGHGYRKYCSSECSANDSEVQNKKRLTCLENNGTEYPTQSLLVKEKIENINNELYGGT